MGRGGSGSRTPRSAVGPKSDQGSELQDGQGWDGMSQHVANDTSPAASDAGTGRRRQDARDLEDAQSCLAKATDSFGNESHLEASQ